MERHLHGPLTLPKHPDLLKEINDTQISIKLHYTDWGKDNSEVVKKARSGVSPTTWEEVSQLLIKCYQAINEQREDPRKY